MKIATTIKVPRESTFAGFDEVVEKLRERGYPQPTKDQKSIRWELDLGNEPVEAVFGFKEVLDEVQAVLRACGYDHFALDDPAQWERVAH